MDEGTLLSPSLQAAKALVSGVPYPCASVIRFLRDGRLLGKTDSG